MVKTKGKIFLLIDDNEIDNIVNAKMLKMSDVVDEVIIKKSGQEALDYLKAQSGNNERIVPHVILLDIHMPGMDGFEFLNKFKNLSGEITGKSEVYLLSSSQDSWHLNRAESNPFVKKVLKKPLDINKLTGDSG